MPLEQQANAFLRQLEEMGGPALNEMSSAEAREALANRAELRGDPEPVGDLEMVDAACTMLTNRAEAVVVSVDYRLAPEHKFLAAVTQRVSSNAVELDVDPRQIAVGGDSAGGNLAAVVSAMARDKGTPDIAFQLLFYPIGRPRGRRRQR